MKQYRDDHKEERKEYDKIRWETQQDEIKEYKQEHYQNNKDKLLEKAKLYYEENKVKVKERMTKSHTCECGSIICHAEKARHFKSKKHQLYIQKIII